MDRKEFQKVIERTLCLCSEGEAADEGIRDCMREIHNKIYENIDENEELEKILTGLSDKNHEADLAITFMKNALQQVEGDEGRLKSSIDRIQSCLNILKQQGVSISRAYEEKLRNMVSNFQRGPSDFSNANLESIIKGLYEENDNEEKKAFYGREIVRDLVKVLEEVASVNPIDVSASQLSDLNEDCRKIKEVIHADEEEISKLDEELRKVIE